MSSWVRQTPISPPKKVDEFIRLPKESPELKNTIVDVLPYPPPSRLFLPGSGQRMVEESSNPRSNTSVPEFSPITEITNSVKNLEIVTKSNNKPKTRFKVGVPEFVPISNIVKNIDKIKNFDDVASIKPREIKSNILPKHPEPFVSLATTKTKSIIPNVVPTFEKPSLKVIPGQQKVAKPVIAKYEPNNKNQGKKSVAQLDASTNPNITIVIPLYNGVEFLNEALQSVKRQTYQHWTGVIGVNGYGQTGEPIFSKAFDIVYDAGLSKRFSVINLPDVKGAANAINHMVGQATTPYIAHLDADDLWLSKKLEYQISVFEQDPAIGIVGSMCRYFGDSNDFKILPPGMLTIDDFAKFNPLIHSSILLKREYAIYSDEFVAYDYDCWIRNVKNGVNVFNINNILVLHRIHSKSFYNTSGKQDPEAIKRKYGLTG
jgi:hypothetical protein